MLWQQWVRPAEIFTSNNQIALKFIILYGMWHAMMKKKLFKHELTPFLSFIMFYFQLRVTTANTTWFPRLVVKAFSKKSSNVIKKQPFADVLQNRRFKIFTICFRPVTLLKRDSNTGVFKSSFFIKHLWWLLLAIKY